jgi:acylglycerol lipase
MKPFDLSWRTREGLKITSRCWDCIEDPQAVVCLVHGLGEHAGRYNHVADRLNDAGFAVLALDLRGHGLSEGKRGHTPSLDVLHEDISHLTQTAKERFPGKPVFLYGHSLGGLLSLGFVLSHRPELAGVVVSGLPMRTTLHQQKLKIAIAKILGRALPAVTISSGLDPSTICSDRDVVYAYTCDPLVHDRISYGMGILLLSEVGRLDAQAAGFPLPLLIMHGRNDQLGFVEGSEEFARRVKRNCTFKVWEGLGHEIHNEPGKDEVLDFTIGWLNKQIRESANQLDKA